MCESSYLYHLGLALEGQDPLDIHWKGRCNYDDEGGVLRTRRGCIFCHVFDHFRIVSSIPGGSIPAPRRMDKETMQVPEFSASGSISL
jgi:hypothetical protein